MSLPPGNMESTHSRMPGLKGGIPIQTLLYNTVNAAAQTHLADSSCRLQHQSGSTSHFDNINVLTFTALRIPFSYTGY